MINQKIAIAVPVEEKLLSPLHLWGDRFDWSHVEEVHLIHVVKKNITPLEFGLVEMPDERTFQEMRPTLESHLRQEAREIIPHNFNGKIFYHLSRDFSPEDEMNDFLRKLGVTMVVVSTRGKHGLNGLFHHSFTEQMIKTAPCDVFVVRPAA